jgi:hypothetical protein
MPTQASQRWKESGSSTGQLGHVLLYDRRHTGSGIFSFFKRRERIILGDPEAIVENGAVSMMLDGVF